MTGRFEFLYPEMALFVTTCVVMVLGLSRASSTRKLTAWVAGLGVIAAGVLAALTTPLPGAVVEGGVEFGGQTLLPQMVPFAKVLIAIVGVLLLLLLAGTVDRSDEEEIAAGTRTFDPLRSNRAEFYAFYLFSLTGLMLTAGADDLIWLFLALELTSLPTYIMVSISTAQLRGREAGVKYFFLGALGAAIFLYGFALIYGGTGTTKLNEIHAIIASEGMNTITMAGVLMAVIGIGFKIAAVPMHFYTADVYQGAQSPVSAFLAFVPKTAGFIALLLLCATVGWGFAGGSSILVSGTTAPTPGGSGLPPDLHLTLWIIAALTMTVGNVLALLQKSVKRMLAYSSIAHSGYMLVGVIAGPGDGTFTTSGISAVLFYLLVYGVTNVGAFAAVAAIERAKRVEGEPMEVDHIDDFRGLCTSHPVLGWCMVICSLSLLGLPPLLGFFGKLPLFTAGIAAGELPLVIVLGINSAIAAVYYLRLAFIPLLEQADATASAEIRPSPFRARMLGGVISAGGVVALALAGGLLLPAAEKAGTYLPVGHAGQQSTSPSPRTEQPGQTSNAEPSTLVPVNTQPASVPAGR